MKALRSQDFKNGDFIIYPSGKQVYSGRIIDMGEKRAKIEICVCAKNLEEPILEELEVNLEEIKKRTL